MKTIEFDFQQELKEQIKLLNSLYELSMKQKTFIEKCEYEKLFNTKSEFDNIVKVIHKRRKNLIQYENSWMNNQYNIPQHVINTINYLMDQISDIMQRVMIIENKNCDMMQKIGDGIIEISSS